MTMDYAKLGKDPVTTDRPAGEDVRYDDIFDELQQEIDKNSSPALRHEFDWEKVIRPAAIILKSHSKDLLAASYLGAALVHKNGEDGLADATGMMQALLAGFWEDLFPEKKRIQGRISALKWWIDEITATLEAGTVEAMSRKKAKAVNGHLKAITGFLEDHAEDFRVEDIHELFTISQLSTTVASLPQKKGAPKNNALSHPEPEADYPAVEDAEMLPSSAGAAKQITKHFSDIKLLAKSIRKQSPEKPMPYRWARMVIWDTIDMLPPAVDGRTKIPDPPSYALGALEYLKEAGDWQKLLEEAENKLSNPQYLFCLDITRYTAQALNMLGELYAPAHEAVCRETLAHVDRLPGLVKLSFSKGTPFADGETRQWLDDIRAEAGQSATRTASRESGPDKDSEMETRIQDLIKQSKRKKGFLEALASVQTAIKGAETKRESLLWRLGLVRLLLGKNEPGSALPHVDMILDDIRGCRINEWEPAIALTAYQTALQAFGTKKEHAEKVRKIKAQVALIDPIASINL